MKGKNTAFDALSNQPDIVQFESMVLQILALRRYTFRRDDVITFYQFFFTEQMLFRHRIHKYWTGVLNAFRFLTIND